MAWLWRQGYEFVWPMSSRKSTMNVSALNKLSNQVASIIRKENTHFKIVEGFCKVLNDKKVFLWLSKTKLKWWSYLCGLHTVHQITLEQASLRYLQKIKKNKKKKCQEKVPARKVKLVQKQMPKGHACVWEFKVSMCLRIFFEFAIIAPTQKRAVEWDMLC